MIRLVLLVLSLAPLVPAQQASTRATRAEARVTQRAPVASAKQGWPWPYTLEQLRSGDLDHVLHGVGPMWKPTEVEAYQKAFEETPPLLVRMGVNLAPSRRTTFHERVEQLGAFFERHEAQMLVLSIEWRTALATGEGLGLSREVLAGDFDNELKQLAHLVRADGRPVFLRIGTECNIAHNGYVAEDFVKAYRHIAQYFRTAGVTNAILVWNYKALTGRKKTPMPWYPGDSWVDWWSIDVFNHDLVDPKLKLKVYEFLGEALRRGKPVMIPEAAPATLDMQSQETWDAWFVPFLELVEFHPSIRAFCYSNRDFESFDVRLSDWGNMRLEASPLAKSWKQALRKPIYKHADPERMAEAARGLVPLETTPERGEARRGQVRKRPMQEGGER